MVFARVLKGAPQPGDDIDELGWFQLSGKLPDMAFQADTYMIKNFNEFKPKALSLM